MLRVSCKVSEAQRVSRYDSMNIPKNELIAYIYILLYIYYIKFILDVGIKIVL